MALLMAVNWLPGNCLSQQSVSAGGRAHLPRLRMSRTHGSAAGPAPQHTNAQHNAHAQLVTEHAYYRRADTCGEGGFGDSLGQMGPKGLAMQSDVDACVARGARPTQPQDAATRARCSPATSPTRQGGTPGQSLRKKRQEAELPRELRDSNRVPFGSQTSFGAAIPTHLAARRVSVQ